MGEWNNDRSDGWRKWTSWRSLTDAEPEARPGVYLLGVCTADGPRKFPRLLEVDHQGVLHIGESVDLRRRIFDLKRCASEDGQYGHMAGYRFRLLGLHDRLGGRLVVAWKFTEDKTGAVRGEAETMRRYVSEFGELPPLNYKFNWF